MATKRQRYMISVDEELFGEIEDYRYNNRFPTMSKATANLLRLAIDYVKTNKKEKN